MGARMLQRVPGQDSADLKGVMTLKTSGGVGGSLCQYLGEEHCMCKGPAVVKEGLAAVE